MSGLAGGGAALPLDRAPTPPRGRGGAGNGEYRRLCLRLSYILEELLHKELGLGHEVPFSSRCPAKREIRAVTLHM